MSRNGWAHRNATNRFREPHMRRAALEPGRLPGPIHAAPINPDLPVITPSHANWNRVARAVFYTNRKDEWKWEVIAETPDEGEAIRIATAQQYRAQATGFSFRPFDNMQPMKELGILRHFIGQDGKGICKRWLGLHDDDVDLGDFDRVMGDPDWRRELCEPCVSVALALRGTDAR